MVAKGRDRVGGSLKEEGEKSNLLNSLSCCLSLSTQTVSAWSGLVALAFELCTGVGSKEAYLSLTV